MLPSMQAHSLLPLLVAAAFVAQAADVPSAVPAPSPAPAAEPAARPARRALPPEAFTTPTNFVALVNLDGAVDEAWLKEQAAAMQRSLMVGVKAVSLEEKNPAPVRPGRDFALGLFDLFPDAKILVILAEGEDLPPVLASPYEHWVVMDAGWVKRGGGDAAVVNDRMGKRVYQALGACCGAAYRPEREAVMRYSPTPESLDDCLSHNFHPLNANSFMVVAREVGLDHIRLRPRQELVELGILKPRPPKPDAPPATSVPDQP